MQGALHSRGSVDGCHPAQVWTALRQHCRNFAAEPGNLGGNQSAAAVLLDTMVATGSRGRGEGNLTLASIADPQENSPQGPRQDALDFPYLRVLLADQRRVAKWQRSTGSHSDMSLKRRPPQLGGAMHTANTQGEGGQARAASATHAGSTSKTSRRRPLPGRLFRSSDGSPGADSCIPQTRTVFTK